MSVVSMLRIWSFDGILDTSEMEHNHTRRTHNASRLSVS